MTGTVSRIDSLRTVLSLLPVQTSKLGFWTSPAIRLRVASEMPFGRLRAPGDAERGGLRQERVDVGEQRRDVDAGADVGRLRAADGLVADHRRVHEPVERVDPERRQAPRSPEPPGEAPIWAKLDSSFWNVAAGSW